MASYSDTTLNDPLATANTVAIGINRLGQISGEHVDGSGSDGFLDGGGTETTLNGVNATPSAPTSGNLSICGGLHREIAFIDPTIDHLDMFLGGLRPGIEAIVLDTARPAARQIAAALEGLQGLGAVHLVAHGAPGRVSFASGEWSAETLAQDEDDLAAIGRALDNDGELRLWSCNVGAGATGAAFIERLEQATGADVAAAAGRVGAAALGGTWELVVRAGRGTARPPFAAPALAAYADVLAFKTWTGNISTDWTLGLNWDSLTPPGTADDVVIPAGLTNYPVISSSSDLSISSLSVNNGAMLTFSTQETMNITRLGVGSGANIQGTLNLGNSTITGFGTFGAVGTGVINIAGGSLDATGEIEIANSGLISGFGNLSGAGGGGPAFTGVHLDTALSRLAVTGGNMTVNALTNNGSVTIASGDTLNSSSGTVINNTGGTITISGNGVLTDTAGSGTGINNAGGTINIGSGTVSSTGTSNISNTGTINISGGTLSSGSGGIVNASNSNITGFGTLIGAISGTGTITAKGNGTLDLTGTISSGLVLTIDPTTGSRLKIDGSATSTGPINTVGQTSLSDNNTLEIGANGNLTIGAAESVTGSGSIQLDGGTVTDASGITLAGTNGGAAPTLSGFGTVAAPLSVAGNGLIQLDGGTLTDSSGITFVQGGFLKGHGTVVAALSGGPGAGFILATNGTLELSSTVNVHVVELGDNNNSSGEILRLDAASTTQAVEFNGSAQTLEIGSNGSLTIGGFNILSFSNGTYVNGVVSGGTIQLDGAGSILTDVTGVTLAGGTISGSGDFAANTNLTGWGTVRIPHNSADTVTASGGTLELTSAIDSSAVTTFHIANVASSVLKFDGAVGTSSIRPPIFFDGGDGGVGVLDLTSLSGGLANFHGVVSGFDEGDDIKIAGAASASLNGTNSTLTVYNASHVALGTITLATSYAGDTFNVSGGTITVDDFVATLSSTTATEGTPVSVTVMDDGLAVSSGLTYQWQM